MDVRYVPLADMRGLSCQWISHRQRPGWLGLGVLLCTAVAGQRRAAVVRLRELRLLLIDLKAGRLSGARRSRPVLSVCVKNAGTATRSPSVRAVPPRRRANVPSSANRLAYRDRVRAGQYPNFDTKLRRRRTPIKPIRSWLLSPKWPRSPAISSLGFGVRPL